VIDSIGKRVGEGGFAGRWDPVEGKMHINN
jgi:hypothetical protein